MDYRYVENYYGQQYTGQYIIFKAASPKNTHPILATNTSTTITRTVIFTIQTNNGDIITKAITTTEISITIIHVREIKTRKPSVIFTHNHATKSFPLSPLIISPVATMAPTLSQNLIQKIQTHPQKPCQKIQISLPIHLFLHIHKMFMI